MTIDINYYRKYFRQGVGYETKNNELIIQDLADKYDKQYDNRIRQFDILKNSNRANVIYKNGNPLSCVVDYNKKWNKGNTTTLFREVWIDHNLVNVGELVQFENKVSKEKEDYLFVQRVENEDGYDILFMSKCNNTLKYILPSDHKKSIIIPCITSNMSLYSIGLDETKQVVTSDGKKFIIIPFTSDSDEIFVGQRFLFWDGQAFEVTEISYDKANKVNDIRQGVLEIKMQQSQIRAEDDLNSLLAYNEGISLETPLPPQTIIINGDYKLYLNTSKTYTLTYEDGTAITDKTFTYSFTNTNLATITANTGTSVTLKANNSNLKGYCDLVCTCVEDSSIVITKSIWIRSLI